MTNTILLIGKNGQLGRDLNSYLPRIGDLVAMGRQDLDLAKPNDIRNVVRSVRPKIIVNAAAYTDVDKAETDRSTAQAINAAAPDILAQEAGAMGATLVHYSTDYVFDGTKTIPYAEADPTNPINWYGQSKLDGEKAVQRAGIPHLIFRTAWVFSKEGNNFLLKILRLATQREELQVVDDQFGAPTSSQDIAAATTNILSRFFSPSSSLSSLLDKSGTYHMTASGETNRYGFAKAILEEAANCGGAAWLAAATNRRPLIPLRLLPVHSDAYPTPARRPAYSVLSNEKLAQAFDARLPAWQTQLHSIFSGKE